jgi:hypothetical protein
VKRSLRGNGQPTSKEEVSSYKTDYGVSSNKTKIDGTALCDSDQVDDTEQIMMTNLRSTIKLKETMDFGSCVHDHCEWSGQGDVHLYSFEPSLQLCSSPIETTYFMDFTHFQRTFDVLTQTYVGNSGQCSLSPVTYCFNFKKCIQIQRSRVRFPALPDFLTSRESGTGSTQPRDHN